MNDEALPTVTLLEHEVMVERKTRTIKKLIIGWAATMVVMAGVIGVILNG